MSNNDGKRKVTYYQSAAKPKDSPAANFYQSVVKAVKESPEVNYYQSVGKPKESVVCPETSIFQQYVDATPFNFRRNLQVKAEEPSSPEPMNVDPESPFHGLTNTTTKPISATCICHRNAVGLACPLCGFYRQGLKVLKKCPDHPRVQYIMGLKKCPICPNSNLIEEEER